MYWFGIQHAGFTTGPLWVQSLRSTQKWLSFWEGYEKESGLFHSLILISVIGPLLSIMAIFPG